jgi:hypothetical protein
MALASILSGCGATSFKSNGAKPAKAIAVESKDGATASESDVGGRNGGKASPKASDGDGGSDFAHKSDGCRVEAVSDVVRPGADVSFVVVDCAADAKATIVGQAGPLNLPADANSQAPFKVAQAALNTGDDITVPGVLAEAKDSGGNMFLKASPLQTSTIDWSVASAGKETKGTIRVAQVPLAQSLELVQTAVASEEPLTNGTLAWIHLATNLLEGEETSSFRIEKMSTDLIDKGCKRLGRQAVTAPFASKIYGEVWACVQVFTSAPAAYATGSREVLRDYASMPMSATLKLASGPEETTHPMGLCVVPASRPGVARPDCQTTDPRYVVTPEIPLNKSAADMVYSSGEKIAFVKEVNTVKVEADVKAAFEAVSSLTVSSYCAKFPSSCR